MTVSQSCLWVEPCVPTPQTTLLHSPGRSGTPHGLARGQALLECLPRKRMKTTESGSSGHISNLWLTNSHPEKGVWVRSSPFQMGRLRHRGVLAGDKGHVGAGNCSSTKLGARQARFPMPPPPRRAGGKYPNERPPGLQWAVGECSGGRGPSRPWTRPVPQPLLLMSPLLHSIPKPRQDELRGLDQAVLWEREGRGAERAGGVQGKTGGVYVRPHGTVCRDNAPKAGSWATVGGQRADQGAVWERVFVTG